jgi:hypothetical protein
MFVNAGPNLRIACDYRERCLRVSENNMAELPEFRPMWSQKAVFTSEVEWYQSEYATRVTSEDVEEAIMWFWYDMRPDPDSGERASVPVVLFGEDLDD